MYSSIPKNNPPSGRPGGLTIPVKTLLLACLLLPALLQCEKCGCDRGKPKPVDAGSQLAPDAIKVTGIKGQVEWRSGQTGEWMPVKEGQIVKLGDGLRTSQGGWVVVLYPDGSRVTLKGEGAVNLAEIDQEFAFLLEQGQVEITTQPSAGRHYRLLFGETTDYVMLADGQVELIMTSEGVQVRMIMGRATIHQGTEDRTLDAGGSFVLQLGQAKIVERQALPTTLMDSRRASRIRPPGTKRFLRPSRKSTEIDPGTAIRTARRRGVTLKDQAGGRLSLGPRSQARFNGTFQQGDSREGSLDLENGQTRIRLRRVGPGQVSQEIHAGQADVVARATGLTAETDVNTGKNSTGILVHSGVADVIVGEQKYAVEAGQFFSVDRKGQVRGPNPIQAGPIRAREGVHLRLFYDRTIPTVKLGWKAGDSEGPAFLEVSSSSAFDKLSLREPVRGNSFNYDIFRAGRHYWRVVRKSADGAKEVAGPTGTLVIKQDPIAKRQGSGRLVNIVPDTGIQTTILYQGKVPALTFKWDPVKDAASYDVRVYSEDDMESPVIYMAAAEPRLVLKSGKLKEGTYFWYQAAKDTAGKELKTSQMNKLVLTFDNAAPLLRIDSPRPGKRPRGGKIRVRGLAPPGAKVEVNNKPIRVAADGRFNQTLSGISRGSLLVFKLRKPGLGDVYFTRKLGR